MDEKKKYPKTGKNQECRNTNKEKQNLQSCLCFVHKNPVRNGERCQ
jgi:hypothetical protein